MTQQYLIKFILDLSGAPRRTQMEAMTYLRRTVGIDFMSGPSRFIWQVLDQFFLRTSIIPSTEQLLRIIQQMRPTEEQKAVIESYLDETAKLECVDEARFKVEAEMLREHVLDSRFSELLAQTNEIQVAGRIVGKQRLVGREAAIRYFMTSVPELTGSSSEEALDVTQDGHTVIDEHQAAVDGVGERLMTYLSEVDNIQFGMQRGEMHLTAGYTGEGKSIFCVNVAHAVAIKQGKNVLYLTTETPPSVVRRRLFVRHSCEQGRFPSGPLSYRALKHGRLNREELELAKAVSQDLRTNEQYGKLFVTFLPSTIAQVETRLLEYHAAWPISIVIIDYLGLMNSQRASATTMENLKRVLIEAKRLAISFDGGRGIVLLSPWQMSREAWKAATQAGYYGKASLAETSEAEKSADGVLTILRIETGLSGLFTKLRDEECGGPFILQADYDHILIRSGGDTVRTRFTT